MKNRPDFFYRQSGVIPFYKEDGKLKIVLVSSRKRKRWIFPKGIIENHLSAEESALKEAYEEAGIKGIVVAGISENYLYEKWGGTCEVQYFLMEVTEKLDSWPEKNLRKRIFIDLEKVEKVVDNERLILILNTFTERELKG